MSMIILKPKYNKALYDDNRFHISIAPALALAQFFGLLPITGIFSRNTKDIKFKLLSIRTLRTSLWFISALTFFSLEVFRMAHEGNINVKTFSGIVFYSLGIFTSFIFLSIAYKWNKLLKIFRNVDFIFCKSPYTLPGWSLKTRIKVLTFTASFYAFFEHLMALYSFVNDRIAQAEICNWKIDSWFYYLTSLHLAHIYRLFPVRFYSVLWAEFTDFSFTFVWNYVDLFIMVMSLSIASKFKILNNRLESFKGKVIPNDLWDEIRRHYNMICELNEYVDEMIGSLICVACLSDLYYVCLQILNLATPNPYRVNQIYFLLSSIFLISRMFMMCLTAASINDESLKALVVFRTIPNNGWCQELQRLSNQIQNKSTALSGRRFFRLTRGIIISIAGTIITYELVLIQFDGDKILPGMFKPCGDLRNHSTAFNNTSLN